MPSGEHKVGQLVTEKEFQSQVIEFAKMNGWRAYSIPDARRATEIGYPDITLWHPVFKKFMFAELKREKGKLRVDQVRVIDELRSLGFKVYVWHPSDWEAIEEFLGPSQVKGKK